MINLKFNNDSSPIKNKSIFLAGPTLRNNENRKIKSWRDDAVNIFKENKYTDTLIIPEFENGIPDDWSWESQIQWETKYLNECTVIMFWIPRDIETLPGFTTNVEFGQWFMSKKIVCGGPYLAPKNRYLEYKAINEAKVKWNYSLKECIDEAISRINNHR